MSKKILLWDFDGVIANSLDECLITSYNAFVIQENLQLKPVRSVREVPVVYRDHFFRYRKYVRPAGEYYLLHKSLTLGQSISDYQSFKKLRSVFADKIQPFQQLFFAERNKFRAENENAWLLKHQVYPHVTKAWDSLNHYYDFMIVSNKDQRSISLLLNYFGLKIDNNHIFGADFSSNKHEIIVHILAENRFDPNDVTFIDDQYNHLTDLRDLGINLCYVCWGYGDAPNKFDPLIIQLTVENMQSKLKVMLV